MPTFDNHIQKAKENLTFLSSINLKIENCFDWQVTCSFYVAVHLVNAHLSKQGLHYRSHNRVKEALNPYNQLSISKLPEEVYVSYIALQSLSRKSRYLINDKDKNDNKAHRTYEKHLSKALRHIHTLIDYLSSTYEISFKRYDIECTHIKKGELCFCL